MVLVDDMLAHSEASLTLAQRKRVAQFRKGWRLGHVPDRAGLFTQAQAEGFEVIEERDLTGFLRLNRWRDHALRLAGPVAERAGLVRVSLFGNMIGGNALTQSYREGLMRYTLMVMRNPDHAPATPKERQVKAVAC